MPEEPSSTGSAPRSWFDRLSQALSGEPRNREELLDELRAAHANGLLSADTLGMIEGAIGFSDLTVADVMVPRSQMVSLAAELSTPPRPLLTPVAVHEVPSIVDRPAS